MQSSDRAELSNESHSAQPPSQIGADDGSGHISAPASAPGSAVAAATAPAQAPALSAYMGRGAVSSLSTRYTASAPAPDIAPGNVTALSPAPAAALGGANAERPGRGNLLCRPIAARGDTPSGLSRAAMISIAVLVPVSVVLLLIVCCSCCGR